MGASLSIAVAQPESHLHDLVGNVERHAAAIADIQARVVVFPEMSLTGYSMEAGSVDPADQHLIPLVRACAAVGSVALVGAATRGQDGTRRISMLRVDGDGIAVVYDKMCLGGDEPSHFEAGTDPRMIDVDGWRLGLAICKDTGVPAHASATAALGCDLYVAGVCESEVDGHVQHERAKRVGRDHQLAVAVASFAGATGGGFDRTAGRSAVWRADGTPLVFLGRAAGQVAATTVTRPSSFDSDRPGQRRVG